MLELLRIKNIALIDQIEVPFRRGLNIISGETGAGKSIILESLQWILGGRSSQEWIRTGCDEAVIEAVFQIRDLEWVRERLEKLGYSSDGRELLLKRIVHRNGKNRVYINGELGTLAVLQELTDGLIDLCGQHEHQSLFHSKVQMELVDRYGGLDPDQQEWNGFFQRYRAILKELEYFSGLQEERLKRSDFLKFQIHEIQEVGLRAGEDVELHQEKKLLQTSLQRIQMSENALDLIDSRLGGVEVPLLDQAKSLLNRTRNLLQLDAGADGLCIRVESWILELEEIRSQVEAYRGKVEVNEDRLAWVQERLNTLSLFKRKYGADVELVLSKLEKMEEELRSLDQLEDQVGRLKSELDGVWLTLQKKTKALTKSRKTVAGLFAKSVTEELAELHFKNGIFNVHLEEESDARGWSPSVLGANSISYQIQTNLGEEMKSISKIVSGGELSRMMLAVRRVIADKGKIGVYLFDEIDAGIGGEAAFVVGRKLKSVAGIGQVICITHLPQVAAFASHHLMVRKKVRSGRTVTEIAELEQKEHESEIARMLGGVKISVNSLKTAVELIREAAESSP